MGNTKHTTYPTSGLIFTFVFIWLFLSSTIQITAQNSGSKVNKQKRITLISNEVDRKVDVLIDGRLFTSYIYPSTIKKPVLYPLISPSGTKITRKFPLEPSVGERVDHPHHVGLWFNYGDVNGYDFWNNSDAIPVDKRDGYGTIYHRAINNMENGDDEAKLSVTMEWVSAKGDVLLEEQTTFVFRGKGNEYSIDRITKLTAKNGDVSLIDNKEGVLGIRLIRELEHPSDKPDIFTDANGIATKVAVLNNDGVYGKYTNAEGIQGDDCWGKRSNWVNLSSHVGNEIINLAILDHPKNVGAPTYWHTRGYGLFAVNPLGQSALSNGKDVLNFGLKKGESTTFRHRIIIANEDLGKKQMDARFDAFSKQ
ncbi:MAG TPA: PmoA family protein [Saprospiraceae bacterium]|nr:PmoA family protein [Saprospiraceae bacterium]